MCNRSHLMLPAEVYKELTINPIKKESNILMRRYQKKQLLEKFNILYDAHAYMEQLLSNRQDIAEMLGDCQGVAIEIGTELEKYVDAQEKPIRLLEDYCELVYQISERRFPIDPAQLAAPTRTELDQKLKLAETSLKEDVEERLVVVFFPYKASMWDSMEMVWKKLQQDGNAHCIVVPLFYYIKDRERNKVKKCYEGKDFPADVPIVDYEQFLKEGEYADIAIYHNPYDDTNKITETDSRFFSSNLRQYADTLVYIPYYVLMDKPTVSFMLAPGVKNADYVILQDKEMAEEFQRWHPKQKNKFLSMGSPKIEKALEMNKVPRKDLDIPQQWKDRIRGKKVLFYNTHLVNFLDAKLDIIGKLQSVFELMKEQDDIVLWWRPHPLSDEMGYNTESERFRKYEELVAWYKKEDIGIYDDTPNLHEAIAAADAYYGDHSSLVKLFQAVGKPVLLQQMGGLPRRVAEDCVIYDNKVWYSCMMYNALCYIDLDSGEGKFVGFFPDEELFIQSLYMKVFLYQEHLYFIPFNAKNICVYDIRNNCFDKIIINVGAVQKKFYTGIREEDSLILLPYKAAGAIRVNLVSRKVEHLNEFEVLLKDKNSPMYGREYLFGNAYLGSDETIYATVEFKDVVVGYNIRTKQVFYKMIGRSGKNYFDVMQQGNEVYLSSYTDHTFMVWNVSEDTTKEVSYGEYAKESDFDIGWAQFALYEGRLYLHLYDCNQYLYFEKEGTDGRECLSERDDIAGMKQDCHRLYFLPLFHTKMEAIYIKDLITGNIQEITIDDKVEEQRLLALLHQY